MDEQHLLGTGPLLNERGDLSEVGYAFSLTKDYSRGKIKGNPFRIKEWDYYYVGDQNRGIALTIDDNSYMDLCSCTVFDYKNKTYWERSVGRALTNGKRNLPFSSASGETVYQKGGLKMKFTSENGKRHILCVWPHFGKRGEELKADIVLEETTGGNTMVIATPFDKPHHFYYNQKINNQRASGYFKLGEDYYDLNHDAYGVLDWGRGVWTYQNTWYWSSLSSFDNGHLIGWNLGYGFGNTSKASENMLFVDKKVYKLDDVIFDIPKDKKGKDDFMKDWHITSKKGDIDLHFHPLFVRHGGGNVILVKSIQNQVFGVFSGRFTLNDGQEIVEIHDKIGFAEKVFNRW